MMYAPHTHTHIGLLQPYTLVDEKASSQEDSFAPQYVAFPLLAVQGPSPNGRYFPCLEKKLLLGGQEEEIHPDNFSF